VFKALILEDAGGTITASVREPEDSKLPPKNVTVAVEYTTVNYKDGLVINGGGGLVKRWPHVPGIDFSGSVLKSEHPAYRPGDKVVLTGWRVRETQWGGCAQKASVNGDYLIPLPPRLSARAGSDEVWLFGGGGGSGGRKQARTYGDPIPPTRRQLAGY